MMMGGNEHIYNRLLGIQSILKGVHQAGASLSSASKGFERASFIDYFLGKTFPPIYRFGKGDATDVHGNKSGELDIVIEYPFAFSLPTFADQNSRLYLAENIAAVIEVKSDICSQWKEVSETAENLSKICRDDDDNVLYQAYNWRPNGHIPLFAVGYTGWKTVKTVKEKISSTPGITGVLIIDPGIYVGGGENPVKDDNDNEFQGEEAWALWAFMSALHIVTNTVQAGIANPYAYSKHNPEPETT